MNDCSGFRRSFPLFIALLLGMTLVGPQSGYGEGRIYKYLKNYSPEDYLLQPQNWYILQDKYGVIYVANQGGLLEFDGVSWKEIEIPNITVRSIAIDDSGTIYVGGKDEIGFLAPDEKGTLKYRSLLRYLDGSKRNFGNVWRTHSTKEGIYFWTSGFLFRWDSNSNQMNVWESGSNFSAPAAWNKKFYIQQRTVGLMHMIDNSPVLVPGGEALAGDIHEMVPYDDRTLLLWSRSKGFYIYDGMKTVPFPTEMDDYLIEKKVYHGIRLSCGDLALATRYGGLVILDPGGRLITIFDRASGLPDDNVWYVFEDFQGNLWLALNKGITRIEYASPFSIYDEKQSNLPGIVLSAVRHGPDKEMYAGTTNGLYLLTPGGKFILTPFMSGMCWSLLSAGDSLLGAAENGIFQVKNNSQRRISDIPSYVLTRSRQDTHRIWAGTREGLISLCLEVKTGRWTQEYKFENITRDIRTIQEDKQGNLWLGTVTRGVLKVEFPAGGTITNPAVTVCGPEQGLPRGEVHVYFAAGHIMFATEKGVFRFDEKKNVFIPDLIFGKQFADGSRSVFRIAEDINKNIWFHSKKRNFQAVPLADGSYEINRKPFLRIPLKQVNAIYPDPGGNIAWFAGDGLISCETPIKKNCDLAFHTLIRKVWVNGIPVFGGNINMVDNKSGYRFPVFDYKHRNIRFRFAALFFEAETAIMYRCLLEGYSDDWSVLSRETKKEYTNLDPGLYTFRVQARNVYGNFSKEAVFRFKVLPPWYRTWWAYLLYTLAALLMVALLVKWRSSKLMQEKHRLEAVVAERTREINRKNEQLQEMAKIKSGFFANISHEFRTPLTLILGPLEQMIAAADTRQQKKLKLMRRNGQRLLNLINQLLELSKFDSGAVTLKASPRDIVSFLKGLTASFELLTARNDQELTFRSTAEEIIVYFDVNRMEEVLCNLLINAVKFTPAGGSITVFVDRQPLETPGFPRGYVEMAVRDTGPGIPPGQLAKIFDRFYYSENIYEYNQKGAGIGLSIARELVELHHGTTAVESREGENSGSRFIVRLPLGKDHLQPHELVDPGPLTDKSADSCQAQSLAARMLEEEIDTGEGDAGIVSEPFTGEKEIILVVEDSADVCRYIRDALEPQYKVIDAGDGREGIEKARHVIPDLIVSDIMMPRSDGFQLCRSLKRDRSTSHIPIILLTAKASEENILEGLAAGADDYITKPFSTRILTARIKNLIDLRRQMQQNHRREMTLRPVKTDVSPLDREFFKDLHQVIESNLSDPDFNVDQLAKKLYMGRSTVYRKIEALCGENPTEYIRSYRLKRAAQLLQNGAASVTEVAFDVGFNSRTYFTRCFKEMFQRLPSEFRENH